ncbi:MAG: hypothetical protein RLZZ172_1088 [Bacteroidota bacterium]|jgi:hypothetical protein
MRKLPKHIISCIRKIGIQLLFLISSVSATALAQPAPNDVWEGRILEAGSFYEISISFKEAGNGIYSGISISRSKNLYCQTSFEGVLKNGVILLTQKSILKTNFPSTEHICLLQFSLKQREEALVGTFTSSSKSTTSDCGTGTVQLKLKIAGKDIAPLADPLPVVTETKAVSSAVAPKSQTAVPAVSRKAVIDTFYLVDGDQVNVVIDDTVVVKKDRDIFIINTLEFMEDSVHVEVYDNGVVDGDEITLYVNKGILFRNKVLSEKPLQFDLDGKVFSTYDLQFHANNLGTIAPNTGLIIISTATERKEVNFASDFSKTSSLRIKMNVIR